MLPLGIFISFSSTIFMSPQEATEIEWVGRKHSQMHFQIHTNSASSISELLWEHLTDVRLTTATQEDKHMLESLELVDAPVPVLILLICQQYGYHTTEVVMCKDHYPLLDLLAVILFLSLPVR